MSHKIQITVDEELNETIKVSILPRKGNKLLNQALQDIKSNNVETLTLDEFNRQLKHLYAATRTN